MCSRKIDIPKIIKEVSHMLEHYPELEDIMKLRNGSNEPDEDVAV